MQAVLLTLLATEAWADAPSADATAGAPTGPAVAPSPARQCADAAQGTEVEVCLRLAADHPGAVEEIASALIARLDAADAPDRALLDAVLVLVSAKGGAEGAAQLGQIDDPRAIGVLLDVAQHGTEPVSAAAIAALAAYPSAIPVLSGWLVDKDERLQIRLACADALGKMNREDAADALQDALRRRQMHPQVLAAVAGALTGYYPERRFEVPTSTDGSRWLAVSASTGLAYAMGAGLYFGKPADADQTVVTLWEVGALTGGVAGASLGWLWGRAWPIESGDAAFAATMGAGGTLSGVLIGLGARPDDPAPGTGSDLPLLGGIGGEVIGYTAAFLLRDQYEGSARDAVEAFAIAGLVAGGTEATGRFVANGRRLTGPATTEFPAQGLPARPHEIATGVALAAGLGFGHLMAPEIEPAKAAPVAGTGAALGLAVGLLAPVGERDRRGLVIGAPLFGSVAGTTLSRWVQPPRNVLLGGLTGGLMGAGIAAGSGLVVAPDDPDVGRAASLGGLGLGFVAGALIAGADEDPIDDRDVAVAVASASWATWDVVAIGSLAQADRDRGAGAVLLASGFAAGISSALNPALDIPVPYTLSATSIGLWGGYAGAAVGQLVGIDDPLVLALPGSNLGLVGGAVLVSPLVGTPPLVIAIADAFGAVGASVGATGAGLSGAKTRTVAAWSLAGAGIGLTGGAVLGARWQRDSTRRDLAWRPVRLPPVAVGALPIDGGAGLVVEVSGW